jgi:hypothetical protein
MDAHQFGKLDPDPDPHQSEKLDLDPDPHPNQMGNRIRIRTKGKGGSLRGSI